MIAIWVPPPQKEGVSLCVFDFFSWIFTDSNNSLKEKQANLKKNNNNWVEILDPIRKHQQTEKQFKGQRLSFLSNV